MKRSEMVIKIARYYSIRHCMVEGNYMTPLQFCEEMLELVEEIGMLPPIHPNMGYEATEVTPSGTLNYYRKTFNEWEPE